MSLIKSYYSELIERNSEYLERTSYSTDYYGNNTDNLVDTVVDDWYRYDAFDEFGTTDW